MSELTQAEADALLALEKCRTDDARHTYPGLGGKLILDLTSRDGREPFVLDIQRGRVKLAKGTYQNRGRQTIILARLDFGGPPHRNPDDKEVGVPHIHLFREGFADKWAFALSPEHFTPGADPWTLMHQFMAFCQIIETPLIERDMFA